MKEDFEDKKLEEPITVRFFPEVLEEIRRYMKMPRFKDKWEGESHFIRVATIHYLDWLKFHKE